MSCVGSGHVTCELEDIVVSFEDDTSSTVSMSNDPIADLQARGTQGIGGDRDLMLGTDP